MYRLIADLRLAKEVKSANASDDGYLDVWERNIEPDEDPKILDPAIEQHSHN